MRWAFWTEGETFANETGRHVGFGATSPPGMLRGHGGNDQK